MNKYTELTDEAEISLNASRNRLVQGVYWVVTAAIVLFDGSYVGSDPPLDLVVRNRRTGKVVHKAGPYYGAEAVQEAQGAARAIRVIGIQGYVNRERL
jgi:hypothetical protein